MARQLSSLACCDVRLAPPWTGVRTVAETGSTNADLLASGADGDVLVAERQTAGRGRLGRTWISDGGLTFSVRLHPPRPPADWGWLPLIVGVAVCAAVPVDA